MKAILVIGCAFFVQLHLLTADGHNPQQGTAGAAPGKRPGIVGQVSLTACPVIPSGGCPLQPYQATIGVFTAEGRLVGEVITEGDGSFLVFLAPGDYTLVPKNPEPPQIWPHA